MSRPGVSTAAVRFLAVGGLSAALDTGLLVAGREALGLPLALATTLAFLVTLGVTFGLNLLVVFEASGRLVRRLARYLVLVGVNYVLTLGLVLALTEVGLHYVASKVVAIAVCAVLNFVAYRHWVFA